MSRSHSTKVALVTAGSAGLGAAIARQLASNAGMRVVVNYHSNSERADTLIRELRQQTSSTNSTNGYSHDEQFVAIKADMQDKASVVRLVQDTYATMGRLDVVISNAGWTQVRDFNNLDDNVEDDDWDRCFTANVKSHLWLFHASHRHLEQTEGAFVATASVAGVKPSGSSLVS